MPKQTEELNVKSINRWQLGQILKNARTRAGIAQAQAATKLGYSGAFMSQMERGHIAIPLAVVPKLVALYTTGDQTEDAKLCLAVLYLGSTEQWEVLSYVLALATGRDVETLRTGVERTVKLRLKECGLDVCL